MGINGFVTGFITASILAGLAMVTMFPSNLEKMQMRVDAYNMCMSRSGSLRCHMTPDDFVDYYDLKYKIEQLENR